MNPLRPVYLPVPLLSPNYILTFLSQCNSLTSLKQIHAKMIVSSLSLPSHLLSKLITLPLNSPSTPDLHFSYASLILSQIANPTNSFPYNIVIRALASSWQLHHLALQYFVNLLRAGLTPDCYTFPFVFLACASVPALKFGKCTHSLVVKHGLLDHDHTMHSLITMYSRCGKLGFACKVFDEISVKDLVSWNSMISGYVKMGFAKEALGLFRQMCSDGWDPNDVTILSVLAACGELGDLEMGKWVEGYVERAKWEIGSFIGSALIDMYGKCGVLEESRRVFDHVKRKDSVIWNSMITG